MIPSLKSSLMRKTLCSTKRVDPFGCKTTKGSTKKGVNFNFEEEIHNHDLNDEIQQVLKQVKVDLDQFVSNPSIGRPIFSYSPMRFTPSEEESNNSRNKQSFELPPAEVNEMTLMQDYLRTYDIEKIREQRVLQSFTFGRKLRYSENCDDRINKAIESMISTECCQRIPRLRSGDKSKEDSLRNHPDSSIFNSKGFEGRTDDFYKNFAYEMLAKDISKEKSQAGRKKRRLDKLCTYKNIKKKSTKEAFSIDWGSTQDMTVIEPIKEEKPKIKISKESRIPYYKELKERHDKLVQREEYRKVKRMIDSKGFCVSSQLVKNELDKVADILTSNERFRPKEFQTFYRRNSQNSNGLQHRLGTATGNKIHFNMKLCLPKFRKSRRISLTSECHRPTGFDIFETSNNNSFLCSSPTKKLEKEDDSQNNSAFSTKSCSKQDKSMEENKPLFKYSNRTCGLKLHINKCNQDRRLISRSIEAY